MRNFTVKNHGIEVLFVDITDPENVAKAITDKTRLIWIETPTNPTLKIVDIEAVCKIAKANKILSVVDNTFATPYL
jgi:cystathionine beta-lyase/cystathionine gamma-synthase